MTFLTDERGNRSSARALTWLEFLNIVALSWVDVLTDVDVAGEIWVLHSGMFLALVTWTAGPRVAQYLAPQIAAAARAVSEAVQRRRQGVIDDPERGYERASKIR